MPAHLIMAIYVDSSLAATLSIVSVTIDPSSGLAKYGQDVKAFCNCNFVCSAQIRVYLCPELWPVYDKVIGDFIRPLLKILHVVVALMNAWAHGPWINFEFPRCFLHCCHQDLLCCCQILCNSLLIISSF